MAQPKANGYNEFCRCVNQDCPNLGKIVLADFKLDNENYEAFLCPLCQKHTDMDYDGVTQAPYRDFISDHNGPIKPDVDDMKMIVGGTEVVAEFDSNGVLSQSYLPVSSGRAPVPLPQDIINQYTFWGRCTKSLNGTCPNHNKIVQPISSDGGLTFVCPSCGSYTYFVEENNRLERVSYQDGKTGKFEPNGQPEAVSLGIRYLCSLDANGALTILNKVPERARPATVVTGEIKKMREPIVVHSGLLGYEDIDKAATLAAVGGEHVLVLGPPGQGKSLFYRRFFKNFEGKFFETQLSKFSDDSALFGAPDLKKMRETGEIIYPQKGIADAEWVGIDEIFDASDICLRTLNGWLNERKVLRGSQVMDVPLQTCIATANYSRTNEIIAAVIDRFAIAVVAPRLTDAQRKILYDGQAFETIPEPAKKISMDEIQAMRHAAKNVKIPDALITTMVHWAQSQGFSPRRERVMAKLMKINAAMENRTGVDERDLEVLKWVIPMSAGMAEGRRMDDPSADLRDGIRKALNEQKQIAMIDQFRNVKKEAGDRTMTYVKNLAAAIRSIKDILPVTQKVTDYKANIMSNLQQIHKEQLDSLGLMVS